jgi:pimeloyl-ACP methyl ester carboxylesterase/DNA-binding CsgD family transcriptional regulator
MHAPPVQYLGTGDGYNLAYWDIGEGRPVVLVPSRLNSLRQVWNRFGPWFRPLMEGNRFISFDARGQGLSTRGLRPDISMEHFLGDLELIIDHLNLTRFVLLGQGFGGHVAVRYAAVHPERISALVLATVTVEIRAWNMPFWLGVAEENWDLFLRSLAPRSFAGEALQNWIANVKEVETHADYVLAQRVAAPSRIDDALPLLRAPTLVLHPRNYVMVPEVEAPKLAGAIPNARMVMLSSNGNDFLGDPEEFVAAIRAFLEEFPAETTPAAARPNLHSAGLSTREAEVLLLIAQGLSNQQIADHLVISVRTVERHINHIYEKIGAHNRAQATAYALSRSVLAP